MGAQTAMLAQVGALDPDGQEYIDFFTSEGIDVNGIKRVPD